ncbi:MAG: ABC transporter ATP-binding protein [Muribaculaceae bacterium]|nr:ABC transporter ATP-binding protein [Muribaculaceae bacterium]
MLKARDIHKTFGKVHVLKGINLEIQPGRITAIVGPSGAGKTTLLQILGTLAAPDKGGAVYFNNVEVSGMPDKRLSAFRNKNIGFVFQFHQLLPEFTLQENVAMPALLGGMQRKEAMEKAADLLGKLGLEDRGTHYPSQLSGGECQRAAVARALINNPGIILADEPSGSLDSENREELHKLFFTLRDTMGATFAIVTHDESLAEKADIVVRMADGKVCSVTTQKS